MYSPNNSAQGDESFTHDSWAYGFSVARSVWFILTTQHWVKAVEAVFKTMIPKDSGKEWGEESRGKRVGGRGQEAGAEGIGKRASCTIDL